MRQRRHEPERPGRSEQTQSDDAVEEQDDPVRSTDSGDCRAGDPKPHERDLQRLPASGREVRVRRDAGRIGCADVDQTNSRSRVSGGKDASPGERAAAQVAEMEEQRDEVIKVLEKLAGEGKTMILVTHEMGFARSAASKIVFMHGGRIWEQGTPDEIFDNTRTAELEAFLAAVIRT